MKYDLALLSHYLDGDWVVSQRHPTLPLTIYNYSRQTQYNGVWNEVTTKCRGLVLDDEGNVIARPFPKFFNYEEHIAEGSKLPPIPNETFEVFEKMDGSLGIFFHYAGEWHMATRGSFTSEQAIKGMEIAKKEGLLRKAVPGFTYLFEIIYPENRIVCEYGDVERLVLLSIVNPKGEELPYEDIADDGWDIVYRYDGINDFTKLKAMIPNDEEGYVIRFRNGMRMKIKGEEYVRLHRILTNFSTKDIWELLRSGEDFGPFLERVPDEFDEWVRDTIADLQAQFDTIKSDMEAEFGELIDRKEFANKIENNPLRSLLFKRLNSYSPQLDDMIWKMIKPKYEKPFKKDGREEETY